MFTENKTIESCRSYIESQFLHIHDLTKRDKELRAYPFITISSSAGSGGMTVSNILARYLNLHDKKAHCKWTIFNKDLLIEVMNNERFYAGISKRLREEHYSEMEEIFEEFFGMHPSKREMITNISRTIHSLSKMGNCIIMGKGANIITAGDKSGIRIRITGSEKKRIKHLQEYYGFSKKDAEKYMRKEDRDRSAYIKKVFGRNINEPSDYDLIINTDNFSYEDSAEFIGDLAMKLYTRK